MSDAQHYRTKEEVAEYIKLDPIYKVLEVIKEKKYATDEEIKAIDSSVKEHIKEIVKFAEESPFPDDSALYADVYAQEDYPFIKN